MTSIIINLICIQIFMVFVIDLSGFVDNIKLFISKKLTNNRIATTNFSIKPFDCSLCATFWGGIIYLMFCISQIPTTLIIPFIILISMLAWLTPVINNLLIDIQEWLKKIL